MTDLRNQLQDTLTGAYTLDRELGGGGMSRVFVADELRLGRKVVVKVLSPELAAGISAERFELEIKLAASLQQANIVPVLSAGDTNGLPYYTMPFVEGESLRARLVKSPPLGTTDILRILGDVARALQYAHERGIVHRDIKPDNVLLSGGTAVVTDFGIAKAVAASRRSDEGTRGGTALTMMGTSIGTPMYMAPEQAAGDPDVDHRADIYAFGCMAYELFVGHPPFHGKTPQRILAAHMSELPVPLGELRPDISPTLRDLIMQCLAKDASARPQSAANIVQSLDAVTSGSGMNALPAALINGPAAFRKALLIYAACGVGIVVIAKAATMVIGLPDWVVPSSIFVMLLGLPVILFTGYVQSVTRRALLVTPTLTPGGGMMPHGTMASIAIKASPHLSWKRATRGGIYALGAFVALIIAFMVTRAMGIGPAASLFAKGAMTAEDQVLVADFETPPTDSSLGIVVSDGVRSNLAQSRAMTVVPVSQVTAALARMQKPATTRIDDAIARELAQREGYKIIVDGKVTPINGGYIVSARLLTAATGDQLATFQEVARDAAGIIPVIDKLTRQLRGKVGESLRSVQAAPSLVHATTASLPALRKFTELSRANNIEQNYLKAIAAGEEAIKLDTTFAQAYRALSTAYGNAGLEPARAAEMRRKAFLYRDHLPEIDRLLVEGVWYASNTSGADRVKAAQAYRRALEIDPVNPAALNALGNISRGMRDDAQAESLYAVIIRTTPSYAFAYSNQVVAQLNQGRVADAQKTWDAFQKVSPNSPTATRWSLIANAYGIDSARAACDKATASPNLQQRADAFACISTVAITKGQLNAAFAGVRRTLDTDSSRGVRDVGFELALRANRALAAAWFLNKNAEAERIIDSLIPNIPLVNPPIPMLGAPLVMIQAYALANAPAKARAYRDKWLASLDTTRLRLESASLHYSAGRIAVAEKRYDVAIRELIKADTLYDGKPSGCNGCNLPELGRAYDLANQHDKAIETFEKYLATPYSGKWNSRDPIYLSAIEKRLGELYEEKGQTAKAIEHLQKFVDLWKDADPELQPSVTAARVRLARLLKSEARSR